MASKESADEGLSFVSSASRFKTNEYITVFFATTYYAIPNERVSSLTNKEFIVPEERITNTS